MDGWDDFLCALIVAMVFSALWDVDGPCRCDLVTGYNVAESLEDENCWRVSTVGFGISCRPRQLLWIELKLVAKFAKFVKFAKSPR